MTENTKTTYDMEQLDAESIQALEDQVLGELIRDLVHSMIPHAHHGILEGAFELVDEDAVTALREAAWKGVGELEPFSLDARDLMGTKEDDELQEILAAALTEAERRGEPAIFDRLRQMGDDTCTFLAMEIEDWQTRYELEEGVDF